MKAKIFLIIGSILWVSLILTLGINFGSKMLVKEKWESVKTISYLDKARAYKENKNFDKYELTFFNNKVFIDNKTYNFNGIVNYKKDKDKITFIDKDNQTIFQGEYNLYEAEDEITLILDTKYGLINYIFKRK